MPAKHKGTVYKDIEVKNPMNNSSDKAYADLLEDKMKEAARWRLAGFGSLALFAISLLLFNSSIRRQQTIPVLVNVMPSGEASYLGEVRQSSFEVPEAAVVYQVRKFISSLRSVSTDYYVVYANIEDCYAMITSGYEPVMTRMLRAASPFDIVGRSRRTVEFESIIKITNETYQADWTEISMEGSSQKRARMRALISVKLFQPTNETIRRNPLGIYIDNFEMAELQ